MKKDKYDYIEYDDLNIYLQDIADMVGMVVLREMIRQLQGLQIYIPAFNRIRPAVNRLISENQHLSSHEIAIKFNLSETFIKKIQKELQNDN